MKEIKNKRVISKLDSSNKDINNMLIEGDNYEALSVLNYTHEEKIDLIYIDPPYNTGNKDFIYNDNLVNKEDTFKHTKWLNFMEKRLVLARELLKEDGVIVLHIDEHEYINLVQLMEKVFGISNNLGTIIWNKMNPKGNVKALSVMHEYIICFAKDKEIIHSSKNYFMKPKVNAAKILEKAAELFNKIGTTNIPPDIKKYGKLLNTSSSEINKYKYTYDLNQVNKEFKSWINTQDFTGGEKMYNNIDSKGIVYQADSLTAPTNSSNKEHVIHSITKKPCKVPSLGWRNKPEKMQELLDKNLIVFGKDETTIPRHKRLLKDNILEAVPSIYSNGSNDKNLLKGLGVNFDFPKPISMAKFMIKCIHPKAKLILDFFAGSGTTGHAVLDLNKEDGGNRNFILCTNNENSICEAVTYPRIKKAIEGYTTPKGKVIEGLGGNLHYFKARDPR